MNKDGIPTLTELIDKATMLADDAQYQADESSFLGSIAFSQIAIARIQYRQLDIMQAMLKNMPALREDQK